MMLDPLLTNVLRRRIGASFLDLGVIGLIAGAVSFFRAEKFTPQTTDPSTGEIIWSSADNARLNELSSDSLNRMAQLGDTQYIWTRDEFVVLALIVALAVAVLFVLLPSVSQSTIGQRVFHLRTSDLKGKPATTSQHFVRTLGGVLDLFPFVIPGLLGWLVASRSKEKQRIGDRLAKTTVIDAKGAIRLLSEEELGQRSDSANSSGGNDDSMIDLGDRLGTPDQPAAPNQPAQAASLDTDAPHVLDGISLGLGLESDSAINAVLPGVESTASTSTAPGLDSVSSAGEHPIPPQDGSAQPDIDHSWMTETPGRPTSPLTESGWVPVTRKDPASITTTPTPAAETPLASTDSSALDAIISDLPPVANVSPSDAISDVPVARVPVTDVPVTDVPVTDVPVTDVPIDGDSAQGLELDGLQVEQVQTDSQAADLPLTPQEHQIVPPPSAQEAERDQASTSNLLPPPPLHRAASWQQPKAEPAPVWTPEIEDQSPAPSADQPQTGSQHDVSPLDAIAQTPDVEHTTALAIPEQASPAKQSNTQAMEPSPSGQSNAGATEPNAAESGATAPEADPRWDDDWQAWIYWDATHEAWLRHDVASDAWVPLG